MEFCYLKVGAYEFFRSFSKKLCLKSLQQLVPELKEKDLISGKTGVRSQVVLPNGKMSDDFVNVQKQGVIHVLNAPSPGAMTSLSIGNHIASLYNQMV